MLWTIQSELAERLLGAVPRPADGLDEGGTVRIVKSGPHRTVYHLWLEGAGFYFKHFRISNFKAFLLGPLRCSKAEREWGAARAIARLGLPTFEPVAWGKICRGGVAHDSFLISREIAEATPLDELVTERFSDATQGTPERAATRAQSVLRQELAVELGKLTARLHAAGVEHADFHAANVLVRAAPEGPIALWLIDLHRVYFRQSLTADVRYRNLAVLHHFFVGKSTRTDRLRFYRAHSSTWRELTGGQSVAGGSECAGSERAEIGALEGVLATCALEGWQRADRAWHRGNRHVRKLRTPGGEARGLAALNADWFRATCADPERLFNQRPVEWFKRSARCRVAAVELPGRPLPGLASAVLKCIQPHPGWRRLLARWRTSPVRRAWEMGHALRRRGIDTPCPILYVERCEAGRPQNYLLSERIPGAVNAVEVFGSHWTELPPRAKQQWLAGRLRRLARQVRRLHDSGFDHRDLKFPNLLVAQHPEDPRVWLLDLDAVRTWKRLPAQRAAQNLSRLCTSALAHRAGTHSDRLRFLRCYLGEQFASEWKSWWRSIADLSSRKLERNLKRGRKVA